jgi:hypothetical protein
MEQEQTAAKKSDGFWWQAFLITAASSYAPLQVFAANEEAPSLLTALVVALGVTLFGLLLRWALIKIGLDPLGATYSVAVFVALVMNTGFVIEKAPGYRWALGICILLVVGIVYRLRSLKLIQMLLAWGALCLIAFPLAAELGERDGSQTIRIADKAPSAEFAATPDVVVIVSDGYASEAVLDEFFDIDNSAFYQRLEALGFQLDEEVVANYPLTAFSVSSVLSLNYVLESAAPTRADVAFLYEVLGGSNVLAESLRGQGYRQTYVESGWLGTQCSSDVDTCVTGPWPDERIYDIILKSWLRGLPPFEVGRSFSRGARRSMEWLNTELEPLLKNDTADYVYVHVLAPHPPLFLLPGCESQPQELFSGFTIGTPGSTPEDLDLIRAAYGNQVQCVNSVLSRVAGMAAANDAVMVMFGDHGSDINGQLFVKGSSWNDAQIRERFRPFFAGYGEGCDFSQLGSLVNVGRRILSCLGDDSTPDLATRTFLVETGGDFDEIEVPPLVSE